MADKMTVDQIVDKIADKIAADKIADKMADRIADKMAADRIADKTADRIADKMKTADKMASLVDSSSLRFFLVSLDFQISLHLCYRHISIGFLIFESLQVYL